MIDLFRAFSTTEDFFYEGAFIAKVKYQRFKSKLDEETYRSEVLKSNEKLCIASCSGYIENEIAETLTVYLMMNVTVKEPVQTETIQEKETLWHNFSKEEIADFSHLTGDTNSIHLTENPVVQGLFILKELCNTTKANKIEVKYIYPVYGDKSVFLKQEGNLIKGFSNGILCFKATIF
ncbi:hotdog family protein [Clostridium estertheticum]|uniref:MaoC-like domain-containing protein n=1 Tax=Clostridium estertheticum subsp. estertheticum TaxID=1552 RepID=A0A1J0GHD6_9CLOT|nr:hypothetical protein [Clostridium estertheticum]APC40812.1 hypothetical protein A7L45_12380 [Clostridium estertheticum subsp. estertheticum]MBZ9617341.1 hypothetical protein [Clostridium estertheticum subsp. laramiense]WAG73027.1 hypothetical protein LL032_18030 [Clostridium estertheticum]